MSDDDNNNDNAGFDYIRFEPDQDDPGDKGSAWFDAQGLIGFMDFLQEGKEVFISAILDSLRMIRNLYKWWHRN